MTINLLAMKDRPGIRKRISTGAEKEIKITIRNTSRMAISLPLLFGGSIEVFPLLKCK